MGLDKIIGSFSDWQSRRYETHRFLESYTVLHFVLALILFHILFMLQTTNLLFNFQIKNGAKANHRQYQ